MLDHLVGKLNNFLFVVEIYSVWSCSLSTVFHCYVITYLFSLIFLNVTTYDLYNEQNP